MMKNSNFVHTKYLKQKMKVMTITKHMAFTAFAFAIFLSSCDTPHTMAGHDYHYAISQLEAGDTVTAMEYALHCREHANTCKKCSELSRKTSELITKIESKE